MVLGNARPSQFAAWLDAVSSISGFLTYLEGTVHQERVGIVTYSDLALLNCPLTESYDRD